MRRTYTWVALLGVALLLVAGAASAAETLQKEYIHQLLVSQPSQIWEHRIDLPEDLAAQGKVFVKREFFRDGKLAVLAEEFTATYYYVKVKLPKHVGEPAGGIIKITLEIGTAPATTPVLAAPTGLKIMDGCASRKPAFLWEGAKKYAWITLFDVDTQQTVWERLIAKRPGAGWDEPELLPLHHYKWAVKQSDETARWSPETQAAFRIEQNAAGHVVIVKE